MKRPVEFAACAGVALIAHFSVILAFPEDQGGAASGAGGDATVSLQGAPEMYAAMVEDWETPPEIEPEIEPQPAPEPAPVPPAPQPVTQAPAPVAPPVMAMPELPSAPDLTALPTEMAPPPDQPEPVEEAEEEPETETVSVPASAVPRRRPDDIPEPAKPVRQAAAPKPQPNATETGRDQVTRDATATQQAAGAGGGRAAGAGGSEQVSSGDRKRQASQLKRWMASVQSRVEHAKRQPRGVRGASGRVTVNFVLSSDGKLLQATVARSSGVAQFDDAALNAVRNARMPAAPRGITVQSQNFQVVLEFQV
ncbi:energy transducer TonB [Poseidonocella sp. HB161398]|uniref:energy transducer TonB n=1 Tax=Poseidonocella sp. HB161398 TaxID=2320855 RepID=UPI001108E563|nr:energy transducer TonB [Poseidonocella sp. HB161398]